MSNDCFEKTLSGFRLSFSTSECYSFGYMLALPTPFFFVNDNVVCSLEVVFIAKQFNTGETTCHMKDELAEWMNE